MTEATLFTFISWILIVGGVIQWYPHFCHFLHQFGKGVDCIEAYTVTRMIAGMVLAVGGVLILTLT